MKVIKFQRPASALRPSHSCAPDIRNGEVYASESVRCEYVDGKYVETLDGFTVVHMSHSGGSAGGGGHFKSLVEAERSARKLALQHNAIFHSSALGGQN